MLIFHNSLKLTCLDIIEEDRAIFWSTNYVLTIWWNTKLILNWSNFKIFMLEIMKHFLSSYIPNFNWIIFWHWNNVVFIRCISYAWDRICMCIINLENRLFTFCIPNFNAAIVVAGEQLRLTSRDMHVVTLWFSVNASTNISFLKIPEFYETILRCSDRLLHWKWEFRGGDQIFVSYKRMSRFDLALQPVECGTVVGRAGH